MDRKSWILALLKNSLFVRLISILRPHRFVFSFYLSPFFRSLIPEQKDSKYCVTVASGFGRGLKMGLRIGDKLKQHETHYWLGFYEPHIQRLFAKTVKKGFVVYDIGSYIGFYSLLAGRLAGQTGRVYAFEPLYRNIERVKLNILLNNMQDRIFCIPKAVSDKKGKAIYCDPGRDDHSCFVDLEFCENSSLIKTDIMADTISLDEFVFGEGMSGPSFVKIDVEG